MSNDVDYEDAAIANAFNADVDAFARQLHTVSSYAALIFGSVCYVFIL